GLLPAPGSAAALAAPATAGRSLAGEGGAAPDAQAFLRGMGGREIGIGMGILTAIRARARVRPWLIAGVLADSGDIAGIAGAWPHMPRTKRWLGLSMAGGAAIAGATLLATLPPKA
uniref:hypothetical protein n=1 Tax=uncultured Mycobacterium sp. TaxID=171292 RepID=UPI0035CC2FE0